jgi:hypothetical protein
MTDHEEIFYEIYQEVHSNGLQEQFYTQLDKMKYQDKHRHKDMKTKWEYAYGKIAGAHQSDDTLSVNHDSK